MESVVFYSLSGVSIAAAIVVAASRRAIYAVAALVGCSVAMAGLYGLLGATLVAAVQLIVYAGAVGVAFPLVIVLLDSGGEKTLRGREDALRWGATLAGLVLFGLLLTAVLEDRGAPSRVAVDAASGSLMALGRLLSSHYLLPGLASLVLVLTAFVGASRLARR